MKWTHLQLLFVHWLPNSEIPSSRWDAEWLPVVLTMWRFVRIERTTHLIHPIWYQRPQSLFLSSSMPRLMKFVHGSLPIDSPQVNPAIPPPLIRTLSLFSFVATSEENLLWKQKARIWCAPLVTNPSHPREPREDLRVRCTAKSIEQEHKSETSQLPGIQ
jgi:hypothetical protein